MIPASGLGRRRFLALGGGLAAAAVVGVGLTACSDDADPSPGLAGLLDPAEAAAVARIGEAALAAGAVADPAAARAALPAEGLQVDGGAVVVTDTDLLAAAYQAAQAAELAAGELREVVGYLFTPTELAVAVVVHDELA